MKKLTETTWEEKIKKIADTYNKAYGASLDDIELAHYNCDQFVDGTEVTMDTTYTQEYVDLYEASLESICNN